MNQSTTIRKSNNSLERTLKKLYDKQDIVLGLLDNAIWLDIEKREVIKMMVDIFMDFANELAKKKGFK